MNDFHIDTSFLQAHLQQLATEVTAWWTSPQVLMRPKVYIDGDKWCALYGKNIQDGVAGFGETPFEAMADFDRNWREQRPPRVSR